MLLLSIVSLLLLRPVPGDVARPFALGPDPFAPGQHRGVDLGAPPGARVRAACSGRVLFAGRVPGAGGRVVSARCGGWRVTYLPLAAVVVRRGDAVLAGARVGTVRAGHGGLHLGMRREGRRFGYVDPVPRFAGEPPPPVALRGPRLGPRLGPRPRIGPRLGPRPRTGRRPRPAAPRPAAPGPAAAPHPRPLVAPGGGQVGAVAPWPAWIGLALLLTGAAGGTTVAGRRRRARRMAAPQPCDPLRA